MASKLAKMRELQPRPGKEDWVLLKVSGSSSYALENRAHYLAHNIKTYGSFEYVKDFLNTVNHANTDVDYPWRAAVVARNAEECVEILRKQLVIPKEVTGQGHQKICFLFPGHGSHYPGMGRRLWRNNSVARQALNSCFQVLKEQHNLDMEPAIWENYLLLNQPKYGLVAIFCVEYALLRLWMHWGIQPDYVLGHNSGEFVAALAAGLMTLDEALGMVVQLSQIIEAMPPGQTMAVWGTEDKVRQFLERENVTMEVDIVAMNTPKQTVVTGSTPGIQSLKELLDREHVRTDILRMDNGSNLKLSQSLLRNWKEAVEAVTWNKAGNREMLVSGMEGQVVDIWKQGPLNYWMRWPTAKVNFLQATKALLHLGVVNFVEMLPKTVLSPLVASTGMLEGKKVNSFSEQDIKWDEWAAVLRTLGTVYQAGYSVDWVKFTKSCAK